MNPLFTRRLPLYKKEKRPIAKTETRDPWGNLKSVIQLLGLFGIFCFVFLYIHLKRQTYVFDYTHVPDELKKMGYTEEFITRNIGDLMAQIVSHEGSFRVGSNSEMSGKEGSQVTQFSSMSSLDVSKLDNVSIQGIPFKSLIILTDRLLTPFGVPTNNYVSLEFITNGDTLSLVTRYKSDRVLTWQKCRKKTPDRELNLLCMDAAIFLLQKSNPVSLAGYYFNTGQYVPCINICQNALNQTDLTKSERGVATYFLAQASHLLKGDYIDDDEIHKEKDFTAMHEAALKLDPENIYIREKVLDLKTKTWESFADSLYLLLKKYPENPFLTARYVEARINQKIYGDDYEIEPIVEYYRYFLRTYGCKESDFYWRIGKSLEKMAPYRNNYYDSAIQLFNQAMVVEQNEKQPSRLKISEYANATAYAYQLKAFTSISHPTDTCFSKTTGDLHDPAYLNFLKQSHYHAHMGVMYDSLNYWAWSTLGEYYGLLGISEGKENLLRQSIKTLGNAVRYGYSIDDDIESTEPYCTLSRKFPAEFEAMKEITSYYSGKDEKLKRLMHR